MTVITRAPSCMTLAVIKECCVQKRQTRTAIISCLRVAARAKACFILFLHVFFRHDMRVCVYSYRRLVEINVRQRKAENSLLNLCLTLVSYREKLNVIITI